MRIGNLYHAIGIQNINDCFHSTSMWKIYTRTRYFRAFTLINSYAIFNRRNILTAFVTMPSNKSYKNPWRNWNDKRWEVPSVKPLPWWMLWRAFFACPVISLPSQDYACWTTLPFAYCSSYSVADKDISLSHHEEMEFPPSSRVSSLLQHGVL
jgi:hypothetical protein